MKELLWHLRHTFRTLRKRVPPTRWATVFPDDVFLVSYPKSGNTWMQFLVGNLVFQKPITFADVNQRIPSFNDMSEKELIRVPRPRYIKSHEPFHPSYQNVIYIVRDPRDVAVSNYYFHIKKKRLSYDHPLDRFVADMLSGKLDHPRGTWADNVMSWIAMGASRRRFLLLRYKDLLEDTRQELSKVAESLGIPVDEEQLANAVKLSSADRMRQMEKAQWKSWEMTRRSRSNIPFVRAAKAGQWSETLSPESIRAIEAAWGPIMLALGYDLTNHPKDLAARSESWSQWESQVNLLGPQFVRMRNAFQNGRTAQMPINSAENTGHPQGAPTFRLNS